MSSKTTTTTNIPPPTEAELALQEENLRVATLQADALEQQAGFRTQAQPLFDQILADFELQQGIASPEERADLFRQQFEREQRLGPIQDELLELQLEEIRRGGAASPEQIRLIDEAVEAQIASGESDISRFAQQGLQQIRSELAPSLGLRPTDQPIQDRGLRLAEEATRQQGQLVSSLRGAGAQARLNFPLAAGQLLSGQAGFQQQLAGAAGQFSQQLQQQAFQNRLRLTGGAPSLGLSGPGLQAALAGQRFQGAGTTSTTSGGFFQGLGGLGGFLTGVGAVT